MTTTTIEPTAGHPDAPEARLVLPAGVPDEAWHALRRSGIGGSDVAALLGLDKWRSPRHVYEAKHGRGDDVDTEPAEFGREMEDVIARVWSRRTGIPIATPPGTFANIERPWMLANVDRFALWDEEARAVAGPVECKNRSEWQLSDWEEDEAPDAPAIQCHWYMAVGGWDVGYVAACVGGNKLRWHRLERDEALIQHLVEYCEGWWERHVLEGAPPPPDGHPATKDLLAHLWDVEPESVAEVDIEQARDLRKRRAALKDAIKRADHKLTLIENTMRLAAGPAEIVKTPGGRTAWTWKQNGNFDAKAFTAAYPEIARKYTRTVEALDVDAIKANHKDEYREHRGRRLLVPAKGL